jgi:hypothetical protein
MWLEEKSIMQATVGHRATQILRGLVIADVVITVVSAVAVLVDPQILPADLKKYAVDLAETGRFGTGFLRSWWQSHW